MNLEKNKSFKYFILTIFAPIVGIVVIYSYAYFYIQNEINITKYELNGLRKVNQIQDIVLDIQRLRGLSSIVNKDEKCYIDIKNIKQNIKQNIEKLKKEIVQVDQTVNLKKEFLELFNDIDLHISHNTNFTNLTNTISNAIIFLENIAHHSKLVLDSQLKSYILIETVVSILPELIEYNGQIRGISTSVKNNELSQKQKQHIIIQLSKIDERLKKLKFNMSHIKSFDNFNIIKVSYDNMLNGQNKLILFAKKELLSKDKIMIKPNDMFRLVTSNIEIIASLYKTNSKELKNILEQRANDKKTIILWIVFAGVVSILVIFYINILFFIKNRVFVEKIEELSITDGMTNLYNRRYFDNIFDKQLRIQQRANQNLIFIMMDIDHFKQYNDTYGHQAGDDTLIAVAKSLKDSLHRANDMVFRLGGEEFGVLCNNMDEEKALIFANKLRINIQNLKIEHTKNSASQCVTISMGLIIVEPYITCEMSNIYKCADEALYSAKQNGRNQVSVYTGDNSNTKINSCDI